MIVNSIQAQNVNYAFKEALWKLRVNGVKEESRNGPVLVMPGPFLTTFMAPWQRVLFNPVRDANPVFHLMEAIWMLAGRADVDFLLPFNSRYNEYAEDNGYIHGAYGSRWRNWFGHDDQIVRAVRLLQSNRNSRQVVISMWDPSEDLVHFPYKDRPCNTHIYLDCRGGKLNMTVCCRSNDMLWGAYGANVVHFSILQEVIAACVGVPMGHYTQMSNNFHVYTDLPLTKQLIESPPMECYDFYSTVLHAVHVPFFREDHIEDILEDCEAFCNNKPTKTYFLRRVAEPLREAYLARKAGADYTQALRLVEDCDWKLAFRQWIDRREEKTA